MQRQLHLNLFIHGRGHHEASWRHPASSPLPLTDIRYYVDLAQRADARPDHPAGRALGAMDEHLLQEPLCSWRRIPRQQTLVDRPASGDLHRALQPRASVRVH